MTKHNYIEELFLIADKSMYAGDLKAIVREFSALNPLPIDYLERYGTLLDRYFNLREVA